MLGYAVTCTADSTTAGRRDERGLLRLWAAVEAAPKPAVIVIKDIGPERSRSCHMGEVMATTAKALGGVGCISDGGLRDVNEVQALGGFQYFCPGFVVSHGNPVICEVNIPVTLAAPRRAARRSPSRRRERCSGDSGQRGRSRGRPGAQGAGGGRRSAGIPTKTGADRRGAPAVSGALERIDWRRSRPRGGALPPAASAAVRPVCASWGRRC